MKRRSQLWGEREKSHPDGGGVGRWGGGGMGRGWGWGGVGRGGRCGARQEEARQDLLEVGMGMGERAGRL